MTTSESLPTNTAAWISAKGAHFDVRAAPYPQPDADQIVVRSRAVAINPLDWIVQVGSGIVFGWLTYPFILGSDVAGDVVEVGSAVTRFRVGDRVLAHAVGSDPKRNNPAEGTFQDYAVVLERMTSTIPDDLSYERAAVIPLGLSTAACGLFESGALALQHPSARPRRVGETVIVWGGSTSVGCNAIQLAVAAGYDVMTTCSPKNFDYVRRLGAHAVFDYSDPSVVEQIAAAMKGRTLAGALAIGTGSADACIALARRCSGRKTVALASFPVDFRRPTNRLAVIAQAAPAMVSLLVKALLGGVKTKFIFGSSLTYNDICNVIYRDFLPEALADGRFVPAPEPVIVGAGLTAIQAGLDTQRRGVSAAKVVVTLASS